MCIRSRDDFHASVEKDFHESEHSSSNRKEKKKKKKEKGRNVGTNAAPWSVLLRLSRPDFEKNVREYFPPASLNESHRVDSDLFRPALNTFPIFTLGRENERGTGAEAARIRPG